jgi:hypothetical protein
VCAYTTADDTTSCKITRQNFKRQNFYKERHAFHKDTQESPVEILRGEPGRHHQNPRSSEGLGVTTVEPVARLVLGPIYTGWAVLHVGWPSTILRSLMTMHTYESVCIRRVSAKWQEDYLWKSGALCTLCACFTDLV